MKSAQQQYGLGLLLLLLTACGQNTASLLANGGGEEDGRPDPYVQFTQAVTTVEPLIAPEFESLTTDRAETNVKQRQAQAAQWQLPPVIPLEVGADLAIATSPELLLLNENMYERFVEGGYSGVMDINVMNAGIAVQNFCQQKMPGILTISRPLTPAETAQCQTQGRQPLGFPIGKDALVLIVHPENDVVRGITLEKLAAILTRTTWSEVSAGWPNEPIERGLVGPDSAAIAVLAATLFETATEPLANAPNTSFYEENRPMVQMLSTTPQSVGIINYSAYQNLPPILRAVPINGITASVETIERNIYPLQQTIFLYADRAQLKPRSPTSAVVNFYLSQVNEVNVEVGLLSPLPSQLERSQQQWRSLMDIELGSD